MSRNVKNINPNTQNNKITQSDYYNNMEILKEAYRTSKATSTILIEQNTTNKSEIISQLANIGEHTSFNISYNVPDSAITYYYIAKLISKNDDSANKLYKIEYPSFVSGDNTFVINTVNLSYDDQGVVTGITITSNPMKHDSSKTNLEKITANETNIASNTRLVNGVSSKLSVLDIDTTTLVGTSYSTFINKFDKNMNQKIIFDSGTVRYYFSKVEEYTNSQFLISFNAFLEKKLWWYSILITKTNDNIDSISKYENEYDTLQITEELKNISTTVAITTGNHFINKKASDFFDLISTPSFGYNRMLFTIDLDPNAKELIYYRLSKKEISASELVTTFYFSSINKNIAYFCNIKVTTTGHQLYPDSTISAMVSTKNNIDLSQASAGSKGDTGATGATGSKGDKGDQGIQGLKGDKGDTGATGAAGAKGDAGDDAIAINYDFTTANLVGTSLNTFKAKINKNSVYTFNSYNEYYNLSHILNGSGNDYFYFTAITKDKELYFSRLQISYTNDNITKATFSRVIINVNNLYHIANGNRKHIEDVVWHMLNNFGVKHKTNDNLLHFSNIKYTSDEFENTTKSDKTVFIEVLESLENNKWIGLGLLTINSTKTPEDTVILEKIKSLFPGNKVYANTTILMNSQLDGTHKIQVLLNTNNEYKEVLWDWNNLKALGNKTTNDLTKNQYDKILSDAIKTTETFLNADDVEYHYTNKDGVVQKLTLKKVINDVIDNKAKIENKQVVVASPNDLTKDNAKEGNFLKQVINSTTIQTYIFKSYDINRDSKKYRVIETVNFDKVFSDHIWEAHNYEIEWKTDGSDLDTSQKTTSTVRAQFPTNDDLHKVDVEAKENDRELKEILKVHTKDTVFTTQKEALKLPPSKLKDFDYSLPLEDAFFKFMYENFNFKTLAYAHLNWEPWKDDPNVKDSNTLVTKIYAWLRTKLKATFDNVVIDSNFKNLQMFVTLAFMGNAPTPTILTNCAIYINIDDTKYIRLKYKNASDPKFTATYVNTPFSTDGWPNDDNLHFYLPIINAKKEYINFKDINVLAKDGTTIQTTVQYFNDNKINTDYIELTWNKTFNGTNCDYNGAENTDQKIPCFNLVKGGFTGASVSNKVITVPKGIYKITGFVAIYSLFYVGIKIELGNGITTNPDFISSSSTYLPDTHNVVLQVGGIVKVTNASSTITPLFRSSRTSTRGSAFCHNKTAVYNNYDYSRFIVTKIGDVD